MVLRFPHSFLILLFIQEVFPQLFSGKFSNFLGFLRPRRIQPQRHFMPHQNQRRANKQRLVRKAPKQNIQKNLKKKQKNHRNEAAKAPVLKHYEPIAPPQSQTAEKNAVFTPLTTEAPSSSSIKPTIHSSNPIILLTTSASTLGQTSEWQPLSVEDYPTLFQEVTPSKIEKTLQDLTVNEHKDGKLSLNHFINIFKVIFRGRNG